MSIPAVTRVSESLVISTPQRNGIRLIVSGPHKCETTETQTKHMHTIAGLGRGWPLPCKTNCCLSYISRRNHSRYIALRFLQLNCTCVAWIFLSLKFINDALYVCDSPFQQQIYGDCAFHLIADFPSSNRFIWYTIIFLHSGCLVIFVTRLLSYQLNNI